MGGGIHRAGWPFVLSLLRQIESAGGVLFDDYVDRTYFHPPSELESFVPREPWIGVFHYPPEVPDWYGREMRIPKLPGIQRWQAAAPLLSCAVAFSPNIFRWIDKEFKVPCALLKHPGVVPELKWSPKKFGANSAKKLIQAGSFLRNTSAIYQLRSCPELLARVHLRPANQWAPGIDLLCREYLGAGRAFHNDVQVWERLSNDSYDRALSENVIFTETLGSGANNLVIECIARETPILINRSEPAEFYLGKEYPLFYDDFEQAPELLKPELIFSAHRYLHSLEKGWLRGSVFLQQISAIVREGASSRDLPRKV